ncbi:MAG: hypothetical protein VW835_15685, partial [Rickettsiales bacterium]
MLIGGATTSKIHTAVKIAPNYSGLVVHVVDASRAVGVAGSLVSETQRVPLVEATQAEYQKLREGHEGKEARSERLPIVAARARAFSIDWAKYDAPKPSFLD